jgi:hypothetical protein
LSNPPGAAVVGPARSRTPGGTSSLPPSTAVTSPSAWSGAVGSTPATCTASSWRRSSAPVPECCHNDGNPANNRLETCSSVPRAGAGSRSGNNRPSDDLLCGQGLLAWEEEGYVAVGVCTGRMYSPGRAARWRMGGQSPAWMEKVGGGSGAAGDGSGGRGGKGEGHPLWLQSSTVHASPPEPETSSGPSRLRRAHGDHPSAPSAPVARPGPGSDEICGRIRSVGPPAMSRMGSWASPVITPLAPRRPAPSVPRSGLQPPDRRPGLPQGPLTWGQ